MARRSHVEICDLHDTPATLSGREGRGAAQKILPEALRKLTYIPKSAKEVT